jgi:hypothetical protein
MYVCLFLSTPLSYPSMHCCALEHLFAFLSPLRRSLLTAALCVHGWTRHLHQQPHSALEVPEGIRRINLDLDGRAKELLHQLDMARASSKRFMDTDVLHAMEQRYVTYVLIEELEREVDKVLLTQVFERENLDRAVEEETAFAKSLTAAGEAEARRVKEALEKERLMRQVRVCVGGTLWSHLPAPL